MRSDDQLLCITIVLGITIVYDEIMLFVIKITYKK